MFALLSQKRFAPLFWTQFLSAFNDNFLKNALIFLIMYQLSGPGAESLITLAGAIFILPFFILSGLGGEMADRYDKAMIARRLKLAEIFAAFVAVTGFFYASVPILLVALALFGIISTLFGPIKYGILPDHLEKSELPAGNALIEGATFIAILLGTIVGGLASRNGGDPSKISGFMLAVALACYGASRFIPPTGGEAPNLKIDANIFRSTKNLLLDLWGDKRLWRAGVMVSLFWMFGAIVLSVLPPLIKLRMGGEEMVVSLYLSVFAVSVAIGSGLGAFFCSGRIVLLPAPIATLVLGFFSAELALALHSMPPATTQLAVAEFFTHPAAWRVGFDLAMMAMAGGVLAVPSFAAAQAWAPIERRARIVAAINVLNAAFMVVGTLATAALQAKGLGLDGVFALMAGVALVSALWMFARLPTNPMRDFLSILFRAFYRLEVKGRDNIAKAGPNAIIALNHVSFLDAALALSLLDHDPIFAIDSGIARRWWVKPFLRFVRALPLDPTSPMATRRMIHAVRNGETLIIFPEGRLTVTGTLMKVYDGAGMIAEKSGRKIVPARIEGLEATMFSALSRQLAPRRFFSKVKVTILEPVDLKIDDNLRGKARRQAAGAALYQIMSDLFFRTADCDQTIFAAVAKAARRHGMGRVTLEDPTSPALSYRKLLIGARLLGKEFSRLAPEGQPLGLMLPNANGAGAAFLGLLSANRPPAMINFTAGPANIAAACAASEVKTIVTSRAFIEKAKLQALVERLGESVAFFYLEDLREKISSFDKARAFLNCRAPLAKAKAEDRAVILFTSGSEGAPKGVVLSHHNILSNVAQVAARIDFGRSDRLFNVLPIFHSFGLTGGFVLPLVSGVPIFLYPSPLHYRVIPELIYDSNATILFGTDTLLNGYARTAHPYDMRSLRYIIAGAEAVKESTRRLYAEKFGLRVLEGYGVTETSPVLALNTPMFNRFGAVGMLCPGMTARLEKIEGIEEGARLHVRGPNVMMGYLRAENPGVLEPPPDGWHDTGDIVAIDKQNFIAIKGRAKRFAKVGGEMISLAAVENLASMCWPDAKVAAVALPDPRKGERIVLCTEQAGATRADFMAFAKARGASELMFPARILVMDRLPLLGSGKIDYPALARIVAETRDDRANSSDGSAAA
ncbi:acyl-[ACP]--phospholipid O-acyltransferase [Rhodoblastus acidophilus]|uniref:Acyl-[ACP]--phospholipid O-acyltransferase n=1 Tax=Candidatus Rhodoblastus alkanivorans TaxID=2954117 RepID=A0ABS9ZAW8_9HYPH|nr:acyl-[ACP]--phospholipid O-acyltransferase [Candidatus Rhodoblastus alkanivorans]MCI4679841.1 acyl-[ACP]--phospholipid O-acyltransferase [Candidatus Rhodoblastus alkanivorans]MCI4684347.1 acyl-[ACP]--phospholipid O-acyltransferase [Candidatus Rhodoblastus alkanivorans]MDI4641668.1 acyl-[ACP]--phospholipid O-acyltransferase [Rhodoblastus acidophilus]